MSKYGAAAWSDLARRDPRCEPRRSAAYRSCKAQSLLNLRLLDELADAASCQAEASELQTSSNSEHQGQVMHKVAREDPGRQAITASLHADASIALVLGAENDDLYESDPAAGASQLLRPKLQARRAKGPKIAAAAAAAAAATIQPPPSRIRLQIYKGHLKPKVPIADWPSSIFLRTRRTSTSSLPFCSCSTPSVVIHSSRILTAMIFAYQLVQMQSSLRTPSILVAQARLVCKLTLQRPYAWPG